MDFGIRLVAYGQMTATLALRCGCGYEEWSDPAMGETAASLWVPCGDPEHEPSIEDGTMRGIAWDLALTASRAA